MSQQHERHSDKARTDKDTEEKPRTVGKYPDKPSDSPSPSGPGTPEPGTMRPPTATGTPAAPTEAERQA